MEEKFRIITNTEATQKEISDLKDIANYCGLKDFSVENSGGKRELGATMPPELFIIIKVAASALFAGFFGAIGVDLWKKIKEFVVKSFEYYECPNEPLYNPDIYIEIKEENNLKIQIFFQTRIFKKVELEKSLKKIDILLEKHKLTDFSSLNFVKGKWLISKRKFKNVSEGFENFFRNKPL